jgi:hypothetical protein
MPSPDAGASQQVQLLVAVADCLCQRRLPARHRSNFCSDMNRG